MASKSKTSTFGRLPLAARVGIGAGLVVLVAIAYSMFFYTDVSSSIRHAKNEEHSLTSKLSNARKIEFAYHQDLAELTEREQRQRDLNKVLPTTASYPAFLSAIQGVANVSGVNLKGWTPKEQSVGQYYAKVPMKLELNGKYHQVAKFFYGVSQLERIVNIENIVLGEPKMDGDDVTIKVTCLAVAFRGLAKRINTAAKKGTPANGAAKGATPAKGKK